MTKTYAKTITPRGTVSVPEIRVSNPRRYSAWAAVVAPDQLVTLERIERLLKLRADPCLPSQYATRRADALRAAELAVGDDGCSGDERDQLCRLCMDLGGADARQAERERRAGREAQP